jgi:hypothetical protein
MDLIVPIGTCRIANPLAAAAKSASFKTDTRRTYGFVHSSREILQQIHYVRGDRALPEELWPYLSGRAYAGVADATLPAPNRYVVEISRLSWLTFDGYILQNNRFTGHFGCAPQSLRAFSRLPAAEQRDQRRAILRELADYRQLSEFDRTVLADTVLENQSYDDLVEDMERLVAVLPPDTLYLSHCNVVDADGNLLKDRARAVKYVAKASRRLGLRFLDPSPLLAAYGQERGLAAGGKDLNHYSKEFCVVAGEALCAAMYGAQTSPPPARPALDASDWRGALAAARQAAQDGEWDFVRQAAEIVLQAIPADGTALLLRARALTNLAAAVPELRQAWIDLIAQSPQNVGRLMEAVRVAEEIGDFELALQWALQAKSAAESGHAPAVAVVANQIRLGDLQAALASCRGLGREAPESLVALIEESARKDRLAQAAIAARAARLEGVPQNDMWTASIMSRLLKEIRRCREAGDYLAETEALHAVFILDAQNEAVRKAVRITCRDVILNLRAGAGGEQYARMERVLTLRSPDVAMLAAYADAFRAAAVRSAVRGRRSEPPEDLSAPSVVPEKSKHFATN